MSDDAPVWTQEDFDNAVQQSLFAADEAYFKEGAQNLPMIQVSRITVRAALESLIGNGLVKPVPSEQWDAWLAMQPPYPRKVIK